jgi:hypothetical protein
LRCHHLKLSARFPLVVRLAPVPQEERPVIEQAADALGGTALGVAEYEPVG